MSIKHRLFDLAPSDGDKKYLVEGYVDFSRVRTLLGGESDYEVSILAKSPERPGAKLVEES